MLIGNLIKNIDKKYQKIPVKGVCFDSRELKKKDVFFAIKGKKTSGTEFINQAVSKGATAIVADRGIKYKNFKTPLLLVNDVRAKLSEASSNFYKIKPQNIRYIAALDYFCNIFLSFWENLNNGEHTFEVESTDVDNNGILSYISRHKPH